MSDPSAPPVKLDPSEIAPRVGSNLYPEAFRAHCAGRLKRALGDAFALSQFGVNLTELPPGAATAHRHWHAAEDEFVFVLAGEAVLVTEAGETPIRAGECAGFPAGRADGHMIVNRSDAPARLLEIGGRSSGDAAFYPDIDLACRKQGGAMRFFRKDGTPYE